ncbi:MAG: hypothetical protein QM811_04415 [Pirellulales bacterium]
MRYACLIVLGLAFCATGCGRSLPTYDAWIDLRVPESTLSLKLPFEPKISSGNGTTKYLCTAGKTDVVFAIIDLPIELPPAAAGKVFDDVLAGDAQGTNAKIVSQTEITLGNRYPGREVVGEMKQGDDVKSMRTRIYLIGKTLVMQAVTTNSPEVLADKTIESFFDSLTIKE